jgi:hypothetical protein
MYALFENDTYMARPFITPDPNDRSVNAPSLIVSAPQILGLFNQENPDEKKERVVDSVKDWYKSRMESEGWSTVMFHGNQVVLSVNVVLANP